MTQTDLTAAPGLMTPQARPRSMDARPETVAEVVAGFDGLGVMRDRVVPGRRASLDWILVGAFGVFVVDEHAAEGDQPVPLGVRATAGPSDAWTVVAAGHEHPRALSGARTRAEVVQEVVASAGVEPVPSVLSVVVFDRASLPPMRRQLRLGQTVVVGLPGLSRLLRTSQGLRGPDRARLLAALDDAFPAAVAAEGGLAAS
jgi:hypothetical protein